MFCQKCGNKVTDGELFCSKCGAKLIDNNTKLQEIEASDKQESAAAENTQAVPPNAAKAGKLQKFAKYGKALMWIALALLFLSSFIHLPISPIILVVGVILGIFISALDMKKPLKFSRIMELICAGIVMVVLAVALLRSGERDDKYIQMIKSSTLEAYPQKTVGSAFDSYLDNPKWESGISEDGVRFVNVTGNILYYNNETNLLVQFILENEKKETFSYNACELNGVPQNNFFFLELLEAIYNDAESSTVGNMPGYVPIGSSIMIGDTRSISIYDGEEWEVTLDSIEFTDGPLSTGYYYLTPDDGFTYLIATLTVRNTGTKKADFYTLGSTLIYDGKYEYNEESVLSDDFTGLAPLSNPRTG